MKEWFAAWWTWNRPIRWWEAVVVIGAMTYGGVSAYRKSKIEEAERQRYRDTCVVECAPFRYVTDVWDGDVRVGICADDRLKGYLAVRCAP